ncbi:MAG: serpin family protein [Mediterranea sp.]|jgi:serpin B|nr:serpin family protein [Mediterranea sp.]
MKTLTKFFLTASVMFCIATTSGCNNEEPTPKPKPRTDIVLTRAEEALMNGNIDFAFRFFGQVCRSEQQQPNVFVSPFSASLCLSMMTNGAAGNTLSEMLATLGFSPQTSSTDEMNDYYQKLVKALLDLDNTTRLAIANSIWIKQGFKVYDDFVKVNAQKYNAAVNTLDFASPSAVPTINRWCADNTNNLINKVLEEIPEDARMYLINALYFKGIWKEPFKKSDTRKESFTNADGSLATVDMMHQNETFGYMESDRYAVAELPYGNGAFSMVVLLPHKENTLDECLQGLTLDEWERVYESRFYPEVDIKLPRFTIKYKKDLIGDMKALGMRDAFNSMTADFSKISQSELYLGLLQQFTYVNVDEAGTEAAAVTIGGGYVTAVMPPSRVDFHVDRPFAFLIKELSTGAILFMGKVTKL